MSREAFVIRFLNDPNDRSVEPMHALMVQEFSEEEAEIREWIRHAIAKRLYRYHVAETQEGVLAALSCTQYLELPPLQSMGDSPQEPFLAVWFIITAPTCRRKG